MTSVGRAVRIEEELWQGAQRLAEREGLTVSDLIRHDLAVRVASGVGYPDPWARYVTTDPELRARVFGLVRRRDTARGHLASLGTLPGGPTDPRWAPLVAELAGDVARYTRALNLIVSGASR